MSTYSYISIHIYARPVPRGLTGGGGVVASDLVGLGGVDIKEPERAAAIFGVSVVTC